MRPYTTPPHTFAFDVDTSLIKTLKCKCRQNGTDVLENVTNTFFTNAGSGEFLYG